MCVCVSYKCYILYILNIILYKLCYMMFKKLKSGFAFNVSTLIFCEKMSCNLKVNLKSFILALSYDLVFFRYLLHWAFLETWALVLLVLTLINHYRFPFACT